MSAPENQPTIPVFAVLGKDYDYDDERYYEQEGYHINRLFESEEEANEYAFQANLKGLLSDSDLARYCNSEDPESLYGHDPQKLQEVRDALGAPDLDAEGLMFLDFAEGGHLTEEQATALIRILHIGDYFVNRYSLYLRQGTAVEGQRPEAA